MDNKQEKELTDPENDGIILTTNERRIILNLRRIVEHGRYGTLTAEIDYHDGTLSKGRVIANELKL